jgi:hypothetical protein
MSICHACSCFLARVATTTFLNSDRGDVMWQEKRAGTRFIPGFCLRKQPGRSVVPCGRIGCQLRAEERRTRRKLVFMDGWLVPGSRKKLRLWLVGGAGVSRQRQRRREPSRVPSHGFRSLVSWFSRRDEIAFVWVKVSREFLIHGYAYRRTSGETMAWMMSGWLALYIWLQKEVVQKWCGFSDFYGLFSFSPYPGVVGIECSPSKNVMSSHITARPSKHHFLLIFWKEEKECISCPGAWSLLSLVKRNSKICVVNFVVLGHGENISKGHPLSFQCHCDTLYSETW